MKLTCGQQPPEDQSFVSHLLLSCVDYARTRSKQKKKEKRMKKRRWDAI